MAKRKPLTDEDGEVRELTAFDFKRARPVAEVLPKLIGQTAAARLLKPRGRRASSRQSRFPAGSAGSCALGLVRLVFSRFCPVEVTLFTMTGHRAKEPGCKSGAHYSSNDENGFMA